VFCNVGIVLTWGCSAHVGVYFVAAVLAGFQLIVYPSSMSVNER